MQFVYVALPSRAVFGAGSRNSLASELDRLGVTQAIIYATPQHASIASDLARDLGQRAGFVYPGAKQSTRADVTHSALISAQSVNADGLIAVGGDAAMNLCKAVAMRSDLPQVHLPMTFGGSEVSPVLRETEAGGRVIRRSAKMMPETVLYDPELTARMEPAFAVSSAFTALANAIAAFYADNPAPFVTSMADRALADMGACMPALAAGADADDQAKALNAAWLAGHCVGTAGLGLHHQLCYALADLQDTPVEDVHAVLLAHTVAYNRSEAGPALARIARQLGVEDAVEGLHALSQAHASRKTLADLGLVPGDLDIVAATAFEYTGATPRRAEREAIRAMLQRAWEGRRPE